MGPAVKRGWVAASVVTRGVVAGVRYSYTGACRWGVKGVVERYIFGIRAGRTSISSSIAFERTVSGGEATGACREWHVKRLGAGNVVPFQSTERRLPAAR